MLNGKIKLPNGKEVDPLERLSEEDLEQVSSLTETESNQIMNELEKISKEQYYNSYPRYPRY